MNYLLLKSLYTKYNKMGYEKVCCLFGGFIIGALSSALFKITNKSDQ